MVGGLLASSLVLGGGKKTSSLVVGGAVVSECYCSRNCRHSHTHTIANKNIRRQNVIELVGLSAKTENNFFCYGKKKGN